MLKQIQRKLGLEADGIMGPKTKEAIKSFQRSKGLTPDGVAGRKTRKALGLAVVARRDRQAVRSTYTPEQMKMPLQRDMNKFYGKAYKGNPVPTQGKVYPPYPMYYGSKKIRYISCHPLIVDRLQRIFDRTFAHYGHRVHDLGLDQYSGCYNYRKMRGGSRLSMHSWGTAIDLDAANNQLKWGRNKARFGKDIYNKFWEIVESEGGVSLGRERNFDWMHFQFARI